MFHKTLVFSFVLMAMACSGLIAQSYVVEGFSSVHLVSDKLAQKILLGMQKRDPQATIEDARLRIARRQANMDAMRNMAEYLNGIKFEFKGNKLHRKMAVGSTGMFRRGQFSYRLLPSGIVIATRKISLKEEIKKKRKNLKIYQVTGVCLKPQANILMAMRQARMDAVAKAIAMAIQDQSPQAKEDGLYQGTVYIVCTKKDDPAKTYQVIMELQVEFAN